MYHKNFFVVIKTQFRNSKMGKTDIWALRENIFELSCLLLPGQRLVLKTKFYLIMGKILLPVQFCLLASSLYPALHPQTGPSIELVQVS